VYKAPTMFHFRITLSVYIIYVELFTTGPFVYMTIWNKAGSRYCAQCSCEQTMQYIMQCDHSDRFEGIVRNDNAMDFKLRSLFYHLIDFTLWGSIAYEMRQLGQN